MNLEKVTQAIKKSWSKETCHIPLQHEWAHERPELGQCAVTALVVQDFFGGKIIHDKKNKHYWNKLDKGGYIDLTRNQFPKNTQFYIDEIVTRESLLQPHAKTQERYELLKKRVLQNLKNHT